MTLFRILLFGILFSSTSSFAVLTASKAPLNSSANKIVPPGTVLFENGLYVDMTEVSNFNWLEYTYWTKKTYGDSSEQYLTVLPDTMVWGDKNPYSSYYLSHPSYQNYPVVGISYQQVLDFCAWRSDRVNEMLFAKKNKVAYHYYKVDSSFAKIPKVCTYRLPTEEEWETFAAAPFSKRTIRKQKDDFIYNLKKTREYTQRSESTDITAPVASYWSNIYGMYNLIGNIAEMVSEEGKAKGGSWFHSQKEVTIEASFPYSAPKNWLGFRCVCEVSR